MNKRQRHLWLIILIVVLLVMAVIWAAVSSLDFSQPGKEVEFGVTFSHKYASQDLGLEWTEVYWGIINDLEVKDIRLAVPWDLLEGINNHYNFTDWEWMIELAAERDVKIVLAIGRRTPRWPECHDPVWIKDLTKAEQDQELLEMLEETVRHFRKYENITAWQVENEPLLDIFGECPKADKELLIKEIELVKSLDERPIMITDTGELSSWDEAAELADIFGVTMYKTVWNKFIGVWRYPWPPAYYYYKAKRVDKKYDLDEIIVSELQAEPWTVNAQKIPAMDVKDQLKLFSRDDFQNNLEYVKRAGFDKAYLWGVEWWYWLKKEQNKPEFWQEAGLIWQNN